MKNREANKISGYIGNIILILVKHGNHLFQNNRGTGNLLEEPHFQGKMKEVNCCKFLYEPKSVP